MNKVILAMILSASSFLLTGAARAEMSAHDIMVRNDDARKVESLTAKAKMVTGGGGTKDRVKDFSWWRKLQADGVHFFTLTRFHFPPEVKNEGILFLERPQDKTDVQIYLPTFKKIRRVESNEQSGSFMGSEFSFADIAAPHVDDFTYKLLREESCGAMATEVSCWVIESYPGTDSVKERTGSSKAVSWIRKDNFMAARAEYSDVDGNPWKKLAASDIKEVDTVKHKWMALKIHMESTKTGHFTDLNFDNVQANENIPDATFTPQNLARE